MSDRTAVYRLFDTDGQLLYVGMTHDPTQRFAVHRSARAWWPTVDRTKTQLVWYDSRPEAEAAETSAIRDESPLHNLRDAGPRKYDQRVLSGNWLSLNVASKLLGTDRRAIQRSLADDERRTREWGPENQGWRLKPIADRKIYQLRRSVVFKKAGRADE